MRKKKSQLSLRHYARICTEELQKTKKNLIQDCRSAARDLNQKSSEWTQMVHTLQRYYVAEASKMASSGCKPSFSLRPFMRQPENNTRFINLIIGLHLLGRLNHILIFKLSSKPVKQTETPDWPHKAIPFVRLKKLICFYTFQVKTLQHNTLYRFHLDVLGLAHTGKQVDRHTKL
jgi:hypothetical protein